MHAFLSLQQLFMSFAHWDPWKFVPTEVVSPWEDLREKKGGKKGVVCGQSDLWKKKSKWSENDSFCLLN